MKTMNREELRKLELSDEQIESVMKLHGLDVANTDKLKEQITALETENSGYKEQLGQRDEDIKGLKKSVKDNEELTTQLNGLQEKYNQDTEALNSQLQQTRLSAAVTKGLASTKARDVEDLRRFLDTDKLELDKDGNLNGLNEQVEQLQKDKPYLFTGEKKSIYDPEKGGKGGTDVLAALNNPDMNLTELLTKSEE